MPCVCVPNTFTLPYASWRELLIMLTVANSHSRSKRKKSCKAFGIVRFASYREAVIDERDRQVVFEFQTPYLIAATPVDDFD